MTKTLQRLLIIGGLALIPFYEIIFRCFPFIKVIAPDTREPKEMIAVLFALSVGLLAVFEGSLKPFRNKFLLLLLPYLLLSFWMAPHVSLVINGIESGDFWFWKPFGQAICFALMIFAVAGFEEWDYVTDTMIICGVLMAIYVILQAFGFDQFWIQKKVEEIGTVTMPQVGGNLGQPTVVASFLVMIFPLACALRINKWPAVLIFIGILFTQSEMAYIALIVMTVIFWAYYFQFPFRFLIAVGVAFILAASLLYCFNPQTRNIVDSHSSGRTGVWALVYKDIRDGAIKDAGEDYSMTGVGLGRFPFIFPDQHNTQFRQAHNDFLEFAYDCGLAGLLLLLFGIGTSLSRAATRFNHFSLTLFLSFTGLLICSLGSFPFQLGSHQFYAAALFGLLNNKRVI